MRNLSLVTLLFLLMMAPSGGNPTPFLALERTLSRIGLPVTEREQGELNFLSCLEDASAVIPNRSNVQIIGNPDSYLVQRTQDLMYPRVRLVAEEAEFLFHIGNDAPPEGVLMSQSDCGGILFTVVSIG